MANEMKPRSHEVTDGNERAPARAMLRAVGMTDDDWGKTQVGVASSWNEVTPCNMPLDRLAKRAKEGVRGSGGFPFEFVTIAVSDGISMGHEGMRASLVSREVIADSVETVMHAERFDALVAFGRLRQEPARDDDGRRTAQRAVGVRLRRLDHAGAPQRARRSTSSACSRLSAPARRARSRVTSSVRSSGRRARPRARAQGCSPRTRWPSIGGGDRHVAARQCIAARCRPAPRRRRLCRGRSGDEPRSRLGIRPRQIMTKEAFENAIAVTNGARRIDERGAASPRDRERGQGRAVARRLQPGGVLASPHIADIKPGGRFHMADLDAVGGVPVVMKHLLDAGLLHGDCLTVTGKTMAENLAALDPPAPDGAWSHPLTAPIHTEGGLVILRGSLAPNGSVVKVAGLTQDQLHFDGHCSRVRRRGRRDGGDPRRPDRARHRARHPLRRPEGRAGHARDARGHRRAEGRGPRRATARSSPTAGSRVAHGASASATSRPRPSTAGRSRSSATATASSSTCTPRRSTSWSTTPSWPAGARSGSCPSRATRQACWRSSHGWSPEPRGRDHRGVSPGDLRDVCRRGVRSRPPRRCGSIAR